MLRWILSPNFVAAIIVRNSKHKNPVINFSVFLENSSITRSEHTYFSRLAIHSNCDRLRLSMFNTQVNILSKNNNNLSASTVPPLMFSLRDHSNLFSALRLFLLYAFSHFSVNNFFRAASTYIQLWFRDHQLSQRCLQCWTRIFLKPMNIIFLLCKCFLERFDIFFDFDYSLLITFPACQCSSHQ